MQVTIPLSPEDERRGFLGLLCGSSVERSVSRDFHLNGVIGYPGLWDCCCCRGEFSSMLATSVGWVAGDTSVVNSRAVASSGSVCFITWSSLSGACCALGFQGDRNAPIHHRHQHAVSLRALLLMLHFSSAPKPQEDENPGHFTWP